MSVDLRTGLEVTAADGVRLATELTLPRAGGPWPIVLLRTYLGTTSHRQEAAGWARHGFGCMVQDVRGRYDSGGDWRPYETERGDGRAAVEWVLAQPWCDGRVAAVGGSYAAFAAWSAALAHPAVRAVISAVPAMRPLPLQPEEGGVFPLLSRLCWSSTHAGVRRARELSPEQMLEQAGDALIQLPVADLPRRLGLEIPGWRAGAEACETAASATPGSDPISTSDLARLDVAALHVGGWHDPFCAETLHQFDCVGSAVTPRPPRALVLGPWWHRLGGHRPARYGERDYGAASRFALGNHQAEWLHRVLGDRQGSATSLRVFLGGDNRWLRPPSWTPRPRAVSTFFVAGERMTEAPPRRGGSASFDYDPRAPRPCRRTPIDESGEAPRGDVVAFTSETLDRPRSVVGAPSVTLWGSTDAPSVDWVVRLLEVTATGRRLYLAHGLVDARHALARRGLRLEPGVAHEVEVRLSPVGITLPAGSRLRLEVTGSAFPSYARNLASGAPRLTGTQMGAARQSVHWGPEHPTSLCLPVHVEIAASSDRAGVMLATASPSESWPASSPNSRPRSL
ncbi:MAG: CocE/NonD family hydrolase [Acidobacteriota bacterium]